MLVVLGGGSLPVDLTQVTIKDALLRPNSKRAVHARVVRRADEDDPERETGPRSCGGALNMSRLGIALGSIALGLWLIRGKTYVRGARNAPGRTAAWILVVVVVVPIAIALWAFLGTFTHSANGLAGVGFFAAAGNIMFALWAAATLRRADG